MKNIAITLVTLILAACTPVRVQHASPLALQSFEFLGCSGDFEGTDARPQVWRLTSGDTVSFLTHTVAACGLSGRAPSVVGHTDALNLNYELHSPTDVAIMCECEYWAKFTFGREAYRVNKVTFAGEQVVHKGTWPGR
ncbi:hypothetical protein GCM10010080_30670 [Thermomonas carbonis]|nr:hypothetical protein GCM10010080_30670 [Thermomonas carbonis]